MIDPHVGSLTYRFVPDQAIEYENPPPVEWETEAFRLRLESGTARVKMKEHYASAQRARRRVEQYLRSWEIHAGEDFGWQVVRFEYAGAEVVDRNPPPGAPSTVFEEPREFRTSGIQVQVTRATYPEPPERFVAPPVVVTMWGRLRAYREERETLSSMAYACLTLLEASTGGRRGRRKKASAQYGVNLDVLNTLARLSTEVGDALTVRKFAGQKIRPYTTDEVFWIQAAVNALIRRLGEWAAEPSSPLPQITMVDLPPLTSPGAFPVTWRDFLSPFRR